MTHTILFMVLDMCGVLVVPGIYVPIKTGRSVSVVMSFYLNV